MESKLEDENISLMNHHRIDFPLYTQLDIFKFLRVYDLQKSCINVSKEWRDTIRRYAGELPKFRDQRDRRAIEKLVDGETVLEANQRLSEANYQRVERLIRKRNVTNFNAAATVVSLLILGIVSSTLVLYNLHRDNENTRISISEQKNASLSQNVSNEGMPSGHSISGEVLAMVAFSWTTMFLTRYSIWLFNTNAPGKPYQLILYASGRLVVGETVLDANQRLSEAYYQRVECVIRKRNAKYFNAAIIVVSILILSILSSILVLYNLHRDDEKSSVMPISEQKNASLSQNVSMEDTPLSISDEVLALVALSWTTLFFTQYCVWLFDKYSPRKPIELRNITHYSFLCQNPGYHLRPKSEHKMDYCAGFVSF
ncbi:hypothetical protein Ddc_22430 [Ditylenchus destructor]|nr:hypothetical protein Ddc_22430 [Ditylenchus destructor]